MDEPKDFQTTEIDLNERLGEPQNVYTLLGEVYLQSHRLAEAEQVYEKLAAIATDKDLTRFYQARIAHQKGDNELALQLLNEYFASQSTTAGEEPYQLLKTLLASDDNAQDAAAATKQLLGRLENLQSRDPANAALTLFAARQYAEQQQWAPAQQALEPLLGESPSAEVYQLLMSCYRQQQATGPLVALLGQAVDTTGSLVVFGDELQKLTTDEFLPKLKEEAEQRKNDRRRPMIAGESMAMALLLLEARQFGATDDFFRYALEKTVDPDEALRTKTALGRGVFLCRIPSTGSQVLRRNPGGTERKYQSHQRD